MVSLLVSVADGRRRLGTVQTSYHNGGEKQPLQTVPPPVPGSVNSIVPSVSRHGYPEKKPFETRIKSDVDGFTRIQA
jgi:hypothetical protein